MSPHLEMNGKEICEKEIKWHFAILSSFGQLAQSESVERNFSFECVLWVNPSEDSFSRYVWLLNLRAILLILRAAHKKRLRVGNPGVISRGDVM